MADYKIPVLQPQLPPVEAIMPYLQQIDHNRWYSNFGVLEQQFRQKMVHYLSRINPGVSAHSATVANCTLGLELVLQALDVNKGARVLLPSYTFVATGAAVLNQNCVPIFADVDPIHWTLTPEIAAQAISQFEIDVVIPVAAFGCPYQIEAWAAFAKQYNVKVIVDAAGALGNLALCDDVIQVYSLHATKAFGIGEGGLVVSSDEELIEKVKSLSNFGMGNPELLGLGTNAKLSEYHAAVGLAVFDQWPERQSALLQQRQYYLDVLSGLDGLVPQAPDINYVTTVLGVDCGSEQYRRHLHKQLAEQGVETRQWYVPALHQQAAFKSAQHTPLPVTEHLTQAVLAIPFYGCDVEATLTALSNVVNRVTENPVS